MWKIYNKNETYLILGLLKCSNDDNKLNILDDEDIAGRIPPTLFLHRRRLNSTMPSCTTQISNFYRKTNSLVENEVNNCLNFKHANNRLTGAHHNEHFQFKK